MTCRMTKSVKVSEGMEDRISNLPNEIIDRILDYMPVEDAARMSILSRKWRNIWPMHSKLIFDEHCFKVIRNGRFQYHQIINKILLQHMGPVVEFFLDLSYISSAHFSYVDQWMYFLTRNGVKKLTLVNLKQPRVLYSPPSYVFSCPSLTHLAIHNVCIKPCPIGSLGNLTSLSYKSIFYVSNASVLALRDSLLNPNLKELNFSLHKELAKKNGFDLSSLLEKLPKIEILILNGFALKFLAAGTASTLLPRTVECLEHLTLDCLDVTDLDHISTTVCLLQSCPSLRILDLKVLSRKKVNEEGVLNFFKALDCMKLNLVKLKTVKICLNRRKPVAELKLLKLLLACSASLDKVIIEVKCSIDSGAGFRITKELLGYSRASPNANIIWSECKNSKTGHS